MKVLHVIPGLPKRSSGTATFIQSLFKAQQPSLEVSLATVAPVDPIISEEIPVLSFEYQLFPVASLGRSSELYHYLQRESKSVDIIHAHGLWMLPNIYPEFARRGSNAKLVMMPHGTLSPYALNRSWWKKRLMLLLGQRTALEKADLIIATCPNEVDDIRRLGIKSPIALIPLGIDKLSEDKLSKNKTKTFVFLSRLHPIKGLSILIQVWSRLSSRHPDWSLVIAGPVEGEYAKNMISLAEKLHCERLSFVGELHGEEKNRFLSEASCFVLPTFSENFGIVVAEALMCGTPVITTQGAPWSGLLEQKAGWWIEPNSEEALELAMIEAISMSSEEINEMGQRGRNWVSSEFSWDTVSRRYLEAYEWILGQGEKPSFIYN